MRCESCGFANPEGLKFCGQCAVPLKHRCLSCGFANPPGFKFCGACATPLAEQPASPRSSAASLPPLAPPRAEGERRQLTVEFIDLVGSTTLSQQLDPEDYHARVVAYQTVCRQVIARYEGYIAQYLGDGVLVYFGYPAAHEDDAVRAVRSGLETVAGVSQLPFTPPLQVRIGIHTGPVVVAEIGAGERTERLALGETPNIAARVQGQAEPNTVVMSQATSRLVQGFFTCEAMGPQSLKNVTAAIELYRVQGEGDAHTRFEVAVQKGLIPLVGREEELSVLQRRWTQAKEGSGQVELLSGEPGIGKSRLVQEFKEQLGREGVTHLEFRCSPYHQNSALYPIIDHLQRLLQFAREDSPVTKVEKLQHTLSRYRFPQADTLPLLAVLLSLPHPEGYSPITVSPQKQKEKTQAALVAWLVEEAAQNPVYTAWEDLHWADPSTLEVLTLLLDQVPTTRLLAVLTFRPEFIPPWGNRSHFSQVTLNRLGRSHVEAMVKRVTGDKALPAEVVQHIVAKTDGVPLFVEELTKTVLESGLLTTVQDHYELSEPLPPLAIPSTLQDSLMARLDRLAPVKEIAQMGAVLGREFSYELLHAVSPLPEGTLQQGLRQLVETELVFQSGLPPQARYLFKHALVQDTAYQSLLKIRRQQLHQQVAQVLEEQLPETVETQPELVAHHYTEAGLIPQAIPYWQQAGQRASQRSANAEAVSHITTGLQLLQTLPDTPQRTQQELALQLTLGALRTATHGFAALEVAQAYGRARELCEQTGAREQIFPALVAVAHYHAMRAEHKTARELSEQLYAIAQDSQNPDLLIEAHFIQGDTLIWIGEFLEGRAHLEQAIALYDPEKHRAHAFSYGLDPGVVSKLMAMQVLWLLGFPEQALAHAQEARELVQDFPHANSVSIGLASVAHIHAVRREWPSAQKHAEAAVAYANEHDLPYLVAQMSIWWGAALAALGHADEGITKMKEGLALQRAIGGRILQQLWLGLQVEAYIDAERYTEGWTALEEAMTIRPNHGDRYWEPELYRLKGELLLTQARCNPESQYQRPSAASAAEVESCYQQAIEIARELSAKSLELRAATSLARLWQQQGKATEARNLLAPVYNWFTEGFDTPDLREAKALLEKLT